MLTKKVQVQVRVSESFEMRVDKDTVYDEILEKLARALATEIIEDLQIDAVEEPPSAISPERITIYRATLEYYPKGVTDKHRPTVDISSLGTLSPDPRAVPPPSPISSLEKLRLGMEEISSSMSKMTPYEKRNSP